MYIYTYIHIYIHIIYMYIYIYIWTYISRYGPWLRQQKLGPPPADIYPPPIYIYIYKNINIYKNK